MTIQNVQDAAKRVEAIQEKIQNEVDLIGSLQLGDFHSAGCFLFLEDQYGSLLEPVFNSAHRPYESLNAVATGYGTLEESRKNPHSIQDAGIASVAYQDGTAFSQDPHHDGRFGTIAQTLHHKYGIDGSLLAIRLDDNLEVPLGVVVAYSSNQVGIINKNTEDEMLETFRVHSEALRSLLQLFREALALRELQQYQHFLDSSLHNAKTPRTVNRAIEDFVSTCVPLFGLNAVYIALQSPNSPLRWISSLEPLQEAAIESFLSYMPDSDVATLNRGHKAPETFDLLTDAFGSNFVWCRCIVHSSDQTLICVANRRVTSVLHHWQQNDVTLLTEAANILSSQLKRSATFDNLLTHLAHSNHSAPKKGQFEFLAHVLRDYFGFDQLLLTKVKRKSDRYMICTDFLNGFGVNETIMTQRPKEYIPHDVLSARPDIMARIVADYVQGKLKPIYHAHVDHPDEAFTLDETLIKSSGLCGNIYFIPCCSESEFNKDRILESILHVGSSDGVTQLDDESLPFIETLGHRVAEWLVAERHRRSEHVIRKISNIDECSTETMKQICDLVSRSTASLGCTLFINASRLPLLGYTWNSVETLNKSMIQLINAYEKWPRLMGPDRANQLLSMFAAFAGISPPVCEKIFNCVEAIDFARLIAKVLYVRVSQSNAEGACEDLCKLLNNRTEIDRDEFVKMFGELILSDCYVPGFGLTGWILRNRHHLSLAEKSQETIREFYDEVKTKIGPPWKRPIVTALHRAEVVDSELYKSESGVPEHVDHISEDLERRATHDSYLGIPIEGIEFPERPLGVIRISNSASMRRRYTIQDEEVLMAAARHISHLFRREYMREDNYLSDILNRRGDENDYYHCILRLNEHILALRNRLTSPGISSSNEDSEALLNTVNRLEEICDMAMAGPEQRMLAWRIQSLSQDQWSGNIIAEVLQQWLKNEKIQADIIDDLDIPLNGITPVTITWSCRIVDELSRNLRRHQNIKQPAIRICNDQGLCFFVGSKSALETSSISNQLDWADYRSLFVGNGKGGGMKLICEAEDLAGFEIKFCSVNIGEPGNEASMLTRVRIQK